MRQVSRFAETAKNSRKAWAAPSFKLPLRANPLGEPRPQAFGSPLVATQKIIGQLDPLRVRARALWDSHRSSNRTADGSKAPPPHTAYIYK